MELGHYAAFLVDIDGVLVRGGQSILGAKAALRRLQGLGRVVLLTNNSTRSRSETARELSALGFSVSLDEVVTSSYVAAHYLREEFGPVRAWIIGEGGVAEELSLAGHKIVPPEEAEWVVVGMDRCLTYEKLARALRALLSGARFLATNRDATFPTPEGPKPGAGAVVGALVGMGFSPEQVVGKPSPIAFRAALELAGVKPDQTLMIGDRLETDILGAQHAGLDTALVLTGVSRREDIPRLGIRPTWIVRDLPTLARGEFSPP
jgi:HAD superfamily hydrolase (TIGR01457 family)